jgi:hypothetical protein
MFEDNFNLGEKVGEGSGAYVMKCKSKHKMDKHYAVKVYRTDDEENKE